MQLPTSISSSSYSSPSATRSSPNPSNRPEKVQESSAEAQPQSTEQSQSVEQEQRTDSRFSSVEQPQRSEFPSQENRIRETTQETTGNSRTDQYRQIASEGADNAQAQDPSLFRIDVYV
jgi:hypothetical protein